MTSSPARSKSPSDCQRQLIRLPEIFDYFDLHSFSTPALIHIPNPRAAHPQSAAFAAAILMRNGSETPIEQNTESQTTKPARTFISIRRPLHRRNRHIHSLVPAVLPEVDIMPSLIMFSVLILVAICISIFVP